MVEINWNSKAQKRTCWPNSQHITSGWRRYNLLLTSFKKISFFIYRRFCDTILKDEQEYNPSTIPGCHYETTQIRTVVTSLSVLRTFGESALFPSLSIARSELNARWGEYLKKNKNHYIQSFLPFFSIVPGNWALSTWPQDAFSKPLLVHKTHEVKTNRSWTSDLSKSVQLSQHINILSVIDRIREHVLPEWKYLSSRARGLPVEMCT